jgi:hypothetical protein
VLGIYFQAGMDEAVKLAVDLANKLKKKKLLEDEKNSNVTKSIKKN